MHTQPLFQVFKLLFVLWFFAVLAASILSGVPQQFLK